MGVSRKDARGTFLRAYPPPHWLTWAVVVGLAAVYIGERLVSTVPIARAVLTGAGALIVIGAAGWRFVAWRSAPENARSTERLFYLTYAGCGMSLVLFMLAAGDVGPFRFGFDDPETADRFATAAAVVASILLAISLVSALAAQWATGPAQRRNAAPGAVDRLRIAQLGAAGSVVTMTGATLMLIGFIASRHDKTLDLSYFRTSSPGSAVRQIAQSASEPLRVMLFFPPANEVKDQVMGYFLDLAATGDVEVEEYDRLASPELAEEHRVTEDGTIVLAAGDRTERITLPTELREARRQLRGFDEDVRRALMQVAREQRTVYLTVGHGELNDPDSGGPFAGTPLRSIRGLRNLFGMLNYRVQDLGVQSGLGNQIPEDAAMVLVLGPQRPFLEPELDALDRYLEGGGSVLLALEPGNDFELGVLRDRLGVEFQHVQLADDQQHLRQRGNLSDRRLIVTDRLTSHASVSTVARAGMGRAILLPGAGHLEGVGESSPRPIFVLRSLPSTFADVNGDFEFDESESERKAYSLAAALESDDNEEGPGMRALVFADADLFSDAVVSSLGMNAALAADAITWLGREEEMAAGQTASEEDVPIVHTRAEDVAWFHLTIWGAPALVLAFGLIGVRRRRTRNGGANATDATDADAASAEHAGDGNDDTLVAAGPQAEPSAQDASPRQGEPRRDSQSGGADSGASGRGTP